jgi:hypothetical protein
MGRRTIPFHALSNATAGAAAGARSVTTRIEVRTIVAI